MQKGQSLVELLLAIGLASILLPALITGLVTSREGKSQQSQRVKAVSLLRQTQEAIRSIRNRNWDNIAVNGTYHTEIVGNQWILSSNSATVDGFTQSIILSSINRDSSGAIVSEPNGVIDASTKKVDISIAWYQPYSSLTNSSLYLTRWRDNISYTETTQSQFNAGTKNGTVVRSTNPPQVPDDGEIVLATGGHSDWCSPSLDSNTLNLPKNGVGKAISARAGSAVGQSSQAAAGTGENSSGVSYANINISDTFPPVPSIQGTFDGYKTNGVFTEQNYAYLATDTNGKQGVIIDLSQKIGEKYQEAGSLNTGISSSKGRSIFVLNDIAYLTANNKKLYTFNIANKSGSHNPIGSVTLPGVGNKVVVFHDVDYDYAFVAVNSEQTPLQIIQSSNNGQTLSVVGSANLPDDEDGMDVVVNSTGTRAYLIIEENKKFYIIDTSTKSGNQPTLGIYSTGQMNPKGIAVVPGNRAIVVGSSGEEYQVVNISNESSPGRCGGVDVNININGVSSIVESDGDAYSYIISDSDPEFRIIEGGSGGAFTSNGIFESQTFNPGYQTADNRFSANFSQPASTAIQFQVALANMESEVCPASFTFVGPSGTSSDWFTPSAGSTSFSAAFPLGSYGSNYANPGQCFRYKTQLSTTDQNNTPVLYDFTINYSP
ncbi:type II secretion system protein [Candidatus Roizmanbacteria bacterium]|nr:type II secretion system protein [Candidatus Roizmanbacteria bacterium]